MIHEAASAGFGRSAEAYDRARPEYPTVAITWLWEALELAPGARVVDVGAGTGKLSAALAARGAEMVAIEPVESMRSRLARLLPDVITRAGTAEELPVASRSVEAVVAGQAFHWFANSRALAEFDRVLTDGGRLGLIWNRRQSENPLQAAISELIEPYRGDAPRHGSGEWRRALEHDPRFEAEGAYELDFIQQLDQDGLADRIGSISFVAALPDEPRTALLDRVRGLVDDGGIATLAYTCEAFIFVQGASADF